MNEKEPRELKDRPQPSGMPWRNVVIGVMVAFFVAPFVYLSFAAVAFHLWSKPSSSPTKVISD